MEKRLIAVVLKHIRVLLIICSLTLLLLYIMGNFITLHPDAYKDMIRSILLVYGVYVIFHSFFFILKKKLHIEKFQKRFFNWRKNETPLEAIFKAFTVVTALNSLMMITGFDIPKLGVFAYIHMMVRFLIITLIVIIWMWQDVLMWLKNIKIGNNIRSLYEKSRNSIFLGISALFSIITVFYCLFMIISNILFDPQGGIFFYQSLLGILFIVTIFVLVLNYIKNNIQE